MSFSSKSRSKGHYPNQNHGGGYYKRPHSSGGILSKIFDALTGKGAKRHSKSYSNHDKGHYPNRHHRKSSWS